MSKEDRWDSVIGALVGAGSVAMSALCRGLWNLAPTHLLGLQILV